MKYSHTLRRLTMANLVKEGRAFVLTILEVYLGYWSLEQRSNLAWLFINRTYRVVSIKALDASMRYNCPAYRWPICTYSIIQAYLYSWPLRNISRSGLKTDCVVRDGYLRRGAVEPADHQEAVLPQGLWQLRHLLHGAGELRLPGEGCLLRAQGWAQLLWIRLATFIW